jgi:threonine dehydratase
MTVARYRSPVGRVGRNKIVVERSGASALAAVMTHPERFTSRRVGVIPSGNVGLERFATLIGGTRS